MNPKDIACRHFCDSGGWCCPAQAGQFCEDKDTGGEFHAREGFHAERIIDAAAMGDVEIPKDVIDRAAEEVI